MPREKQTACHSEPARSRAIRPAGRTPLRQLCHPSRPAGRRLSRGSTRVDPSFATTFYAGRIPGELGLERRLQGAVDEIAVYDRAFTPDEVRALYDRRVCASVGE